MLVFTDTPGTCPPVPHPPTPVVQFTLIPVVVLSSRGCDLGGTKREAVVGHFSLTCCVHVEASSLTDPD